MRVNYDGKGFFLDNQRFFPYSGEMHHFRVHPDLWKDRMIRMKRAFLNCTGAYFYWGAIEPEPGKFNFEDICNLKKYMELANQVGLLVIPRPGGYICAEVENGGHPQWLYNAVQLPRSLDSTYIQVLTRYYEAINRIMSQFNIENGSAGQNIFLYQVENEMFSRYVDGGNKEYHEKLYDIVHNQFGDSAPIVTNENAASRGSKVFDTIDHYPAAWSTQGTIARVRQMQKEQPNFPCFGMEIEGGWFSAFGSGKEEEGYSYRGNFPAEWTEFFVKQLLGAGMSGLNYYMFHGGTNFGYWGAKYMTTTYDYGAPISEWGGLSPRYYTTKLIGCFLKAFGSLLTEMNPDDNFLVKPSIKADHKTFLPNSAKTSALVRVKDRSAFFFLYNEDLYDHYYTVVLNTPPSDEAQLEPLPRVGLRAQSAKIIPYRINVSSKITINFCTLEPYLLCDVSPLQHILLFHGQPGESYDGWFKVGNDFHKVSGTIQAEEDQYWRLTSKDEVNPEEILIGFIETERAKRTWLLETGVSTLPIVSNIYLLYSAEVDEVQNFKVEIHHELRNRIKITLPWFRCPSEIMIQGINIPILFDLQYGVGSAIIQIDDLISKTNPDYSQDIVANMVESAQTVFIGDISWMYRFETYGNNDAIETWRNWRFNETKEQLGLYRQGYSIYRTSFKLPEDYTEGRPLNLIIGEVIDNAFILINDRFVSYIEQSGTVDISDFIENKDNNQLLIIQECMGHYNSGYHESSGLIGGVFLAIDPNANVLPLTQWYIKVDPEIKISEMYSSQISPIKEVQSDYVISEDDWDSVTVKPKTHEGIGFVLNWSRVIYRSEVVIPSTWKNKIVSIEFQRLRGWAWLYVNGKYICMHTLRHDASRTKNIETVSFDITDHIRVGEKNIIAVMMYMREMGDGIYNQVQLHGFDSRAGDKWFVREGLDGELQKWMKPSMREILQKQKMHSPIELKAEAKTENGDQEWTQMVAIEDIPPNIEGMLWLKTTLTLPLTDEFWCPRYLEMKNIPGKALIWWNNTFLGRYWDIGPQTKFYIPEPIVKFENEITICFIPLGHPLEKVTAPLVKTYGIYRKSQWNFPLP